MVDVLVIMNAGGLYKLWKILELYNPTLSELEFVSESDFPD